MHIWSGRDRERGRCGPSRADKAPRSSRSDRPCRTRNIERRPGVRNGEVEQPELVYGLGATTHARYHRHRYAPLGERGDIERHCKDGPSGRVDKMSGRHVAGTAPRFLKDRKSTRLNSSHLGISYAVFCLKKKKKKKQKTRDVNKKIKKKINKKKQTKKKNNNRASR